MRRVLFLVVLVGVVSCLNPGIADPCECTKDSHYFYRPVGKLPPCNAWGDKGYKWCYINGGTECKVGQKEASTGLYWKYCETKPTTAMDTVKSVVSGIVSVGKTVDALTNSANPDSYLYKYRLGNAALKGTLPIHGKWCGPNWSGGKNVDRNGGIEGTEGPVDAVDDCCKTHDHCYGGLVYFGCTCDKTMIQCVRAADCKGNYACQEAKNMVDWYFTNKANCQCIKGSQKGPDGKPITVEKSAPFAYEKCDNPKYDPASSTQGSGSASTASGSQPASKPPGSTSGSGAAKINPGYTPPKPASGSASGAKPASGSGAKPASGSGSGAKPASGSASGQGGAPPPPPKPSTAGSPLPSGWTAPAPPAPRK
eukprot:comp20585_c0_seq5/m.41822 comp20585_c0_seq5/g.41822  ORF comp20585_c0_seq5/g.41822 comp20585_c0_seq5/m.41822 type:complete len:367 (-) comp20585_c0_seq5:105-1205(-)